MPSEIPHPEDEVRTAEAAIQKATDLLRRENDLHRVRLKNAEATFVSAEELRADVLDRWPHMKLPPMKDYWRVEFPLLEPFLDVEIDCIIVHVDPATGEAVIFEHL